MLCFVPTCTSSGGRTSRARRSRGPFRLSACSSGPCGAFDSIIRLLHHVLLTGHALYQLAHLVEAVTRERAVLEVQFCSQRVPLFQNGF